MEPGEAIIVARETDTETHRYGVNVEVASDRYHNGYTYIADVTPDGGTTFRATFRERFSHTGEFHEPTVGERIRVKVNAKDQRVEFDRSVLREMAKSSKAAQDEGFAAIASAAPGTAPPSGDSAPTDGQPSAYWAMRLARAEAAGDSGEVERLRALLVSRGDPGTSGSSTPDGDRIEGLEKLAALHQSGALTDAEFAAEKAKLLGSG